jgi:hypothetical protein
MTPAARREAARYLRRAFQMSERRACRVIGTDRASVRYRALRPDDGALRERLKTLAQERRRFGYRRLHVLLRREGQVVNKKRVQRLYREERLTVRRRGGRKRAIGTRRPLEVPLVPNQRWSLDFIHDQLTDGRRSIVSFLLDRTGSMAEIKDETIGGFNAYLDTLEREVGDLVEFTLLQFDSHSIDTLCVGAKRSDVERLTPESYHQPRAYTSLIDACIKTIKATEETIAKRRDKAQAIVVFHTAEEALPANTRSTNCAT